MKIEEYHLRPELGCSMLKPFAQGDRRKFEGYYVQRTVAHPDISGKREVKVGSLVHQALLEKKDIDQLVEFYPQDCFKKNGHLNPKPASEFRERMELQGKFVLKDEEYKQVVQACNSVLSHDLGELIGREDVQFEVPIFWSDPTTGTPCKARPDFMYVTDSEVLCFDLKVTESINPAKWRRQAKRLLYWLQDAHYSNGLAVLHGKPVQFQFWVVESTWPYRVARFEYDEVSRERSFEAYMNIMRDLKWCYDNDDFSEKWENEINYLTVDPWDVDLEEDVELEGFEDDPES